MVSFATHQGDVPKHDGLALFLNGKQIDVFDLGYGGWNLDIRQDKKNIYVMEFCPPDPASLSAQKNKNKCGFLHIIDGKIQENVESRIDLNWGN